MKSYEDGIPGEEHARQIDIGTFFKKHGSEIEDLRCLKREGEFRLNDGTLIEVKSDSKGAEKYGNFAFEMTNPSTSDHAGWYEHCKRNGVDYLIFVCYKENEQTPSTVWLIPFHEVEAFIETRGGKYRRTRFNGCELLLVPIKDVWMNCAGAKVAYSAALKSEEAKDTLRAMAEKALRELGIDGVLGQPEYQLVFDRSEDASQAE